MEFLNSLLTHPTIAALVLNPQVFIAVLLALTVYRICVPVIDFLNPFRIVIHGYYKAKFALISKMKNAGNTTPAVPVKR